jgi:uncharacterized protein YjbI with pentapeptide repeats
MSRRGHERAVSRAKAARAGRSTLSARVAGQSDGLGVQAGLDRGAGAAWLGYILALFYIGIAVLGVTHRDLFLDVPMKLPLISAEIPLRAFFVLAPILFLIVHAFVLARTVLVSSRGDSPFGVDEGTAGALSRAIVFCALAVAPVLLLLLVLIQFLPYHDQAITWLHRLAILADVALIWLLWPAISEPNATPAGLDPKRHVGLLIAGIIPIGLAFTVATFPGEWLDDLIGRRQWIPAGRASSAKAQGESGWTSIHDLLFHGEIDEVRRRRESPFSNTLVLSGFDGPAAAGLADPKALESARVTLALRGRRFEGAVLIGADLRKADLTGARLDGADLDRADLQGAMLDDARLQNATLVEASLRGALLRFAQLRDARLDKADLQGAALVDAQLQGALLKEAQLQDAALTSAQLQGASLVGARLEGATLSYAQLQKAKLDGAELQGAVLDHAQMQGASLRSTQLQGASLLAVQLQGAVFDRAELQGAMLLGVNLDGASLQRAGLQGAMLRDAGFRGATLDHAQLQGAVLDYAQFQGASLRGAQLQGASLRGAMLIGTSLEQANVWRAGLDGATVQAVYAEGLENHPPIQRAVPGANSAGPTDSAEPGSAKAAYAALKALIVHEIPKAQKRGEVMKRIAVLDPETNVAETGSGSVFDLGRVDKPTYQKVMADGLVQLACSGGDFDREIVLGLARGYRIEDAGPFAPSVVESVLVPTCPVFADLSEADKEALAKTATAAPPTPSDATPPAETSSSGATR